MSFQLPEIGERKFEIRLWSLNAVRTRNIRHGRRLISESFLTNHSYCRDTFHPIYDTRFI